LAYIGLYLLAYQLKQKSSSSEEIDAFLLMQNFAKIISYPPITNFSKSNDNESKEFLWTDLCKMLSIAVSIFFGAFVVFMAPLMLINLTFSPVFIGLLAASALPLLMFFYCSEPYSMSGLYKEIADIEIGFAISSFAIFLIGIKIAMELSIIIGLTLMATGLISGCFLLYNGITLLERNEILQTAQYQAREKKTAYVSNFFSSYESNTQNAELAKQLKDIKISAP
jgi:hypothetical protein